MRRYIGRVIAKIRSFQLPSKQERHDFRLLKAANILDDNAIGDFLGSISSENLKIRRYLRFAAGGTEGVDREHRRPFLGFSPNIYIAHHPELSRPPFQDALAHWIEAGRPSGRWLRDVHRFDVSAKAVNSHSKLRTALHIHVHYPMFSTRSFPASN